MGGWVGQKTPPKSDILYEWPLYQAGILGNYFLFWVRYLETPLFKVLQYACGHPVTSTLQ